MIISELAVKVAERWGLWPRMFWNEEAQAPVWQCMKLQCFHICIGECDETGSEKEAKKAIKGLFRSHLSIQAENRVARPAVSMSRQRY